MKQNSPRILGALWWGIAATVADPSRDRAALDGEDAEPVPTSDPIGPLIDPGGVTTLASDGDGDGLADIFVTLVDLDADATYELARVAADTDADAVIDTTVTLVDIDADPAFEVGHVEADTDADGLVDLSLTSLDYSDEWTAAPAGTADVDDLDV